MLILVPTVAEAAAFLFVRDEIGMLEKFRALRARARQLCGAAVRKVSDRADASDGRRAGSR